MDNRIYDEVRKNVDIVDIIGSYLPLTKVGKNYRCLCPFHNDSNPSLTISPDKQIFRCFSCGKSGNVFTFVRDYENIGFNDAVRKVCQIAGIRVPSELEKIKYNASEDNKYSRLYQLIKDLTDFYQYQILSSTSTLAINYLNSRNIDKDIIEKFKIGYCPESGFESIEFLKSKGYQDDEIISTGVGVEIGKGQIVDRLRGRIIFSITDSDGKVVAYSGRRIVDSMGEKYVNSPETVLFHKSKTLYNYSNAIVNSKKDGFCYVVEGFMDAIALYKSGIDNVVATMGTAFTSDHIKMLKQLHCQIRLLFDSDDPGQIATNTTIDALKDSLIDIRVVKPLEEYKDIDEMLNKSSKDKVIERISQLQTITEYKINYFKKSTNFSNHEDTKKFLINCINYLNSINLDDLDKEYYVNEISKISGATTKLINSKLKDSKVEVKDEFVTTYQEVSKALDRYDLADHQILQMMMNDPLSVTKYTSLHLDLTSKNARLLANLIIDRYSKGLMIDASSLLDQASPEVAKLIGEIEKEQFPPTEIENLAKIVQDDYLKKIDEEDMKARLKSSSDLNEQKDLAKKLIESKFKKK